MIQAIAPASCGELVQGWLLGGEKLISYSIDCYSYVELKERKPTNINWYKKSYQMLNNVFQYYKIENDKMINCLELGIKSDIPIGKGMASSTADLVATALAVATYLGKNITQEEIASLCVAIEPTDSTVFSEITLFDHLKGDFIKNYGKLPCCKVLLLEGKEMINTLDFRKINRDEKLIRQEGKLNNALKHFEKGMELKNLYHIGKAATVSAVANQEILHKVGLEEIIEMAVKMGAYGVNVAHSGSVVGILYQEKGFDLEKFTDEFNNKEYRVNYTNIKSYNIVEGGAKMI